MEATSETEILNLRKQLRGQFEERSNRPNSRPWVLAIVSILALLFIWFYLVPLLQSNPGEAPVQDPIEETTPNTNPESETEFLDLETNDNADPIAEEDDSESASPVERPEDSPQAEPEASDSRYLAMASNLYAEQPYSVTTIRSESEEPETILEKAAEAYRDSSYQLVLDLLQNGEGVSSSEAVKMQAHALFQIGRYKEAAEIFESLRSGFYQYDADWYQLLCYLATLPGSQSDYDVKRAAILGADGHPFAAKVGAIEF